MLIVALTAAVGFLASVGLLFFGVDAMWLRYPLAVVVAYAAFLFLLSCWLSRRWDGALDGVADIIPDALVNSRNRVSSDAPDHLWMDGGESGGGGASGEIPSSSGAGVSDTGGAFDFDELVPVVVAIVVIVGAAWAAIWIVWAAPALLAELALDAALATGLYRRLRTVGGAHWLQTAVRRTGWRGVSVAVLFALAGWSMQWYAPEARSIGQVIQHYQQGR